MTDYLNLKVAELKDLLKDRGIPQTGLSRKQQIVEALQANDAEVSDSAPAPAQDAQVDVAVETEAETTGQASDGKDENEVDDASQDATGDALSETRKRKRRSPTPPMSEDTVNKKLKAAEDETVNLPEDAVVEDAPAPVEEGVEAQPEATRKQVLPYGTSDDVIDTASTEKANTLKNERDKDGAIPPPSAEDELAEPPNPTGTDATESTPAIHPATRALYIRNFVRPLPANQLRTYLAQLACSPKADDDGDGDGVIKHFHLDTLRTHAFVIFDSVSAATKARAAMHNHVWPEEPTRKALWVDYVPEEKVHEWISTELASEQSRRDAKRWEVVYGTDSMDVDDEVTTTLQELGARTAPHLTSQSNIEAQQARPLGPNRRESSFSSQQAPLGSGMPDARPAEPRRRSTQQSSMRLPPNPAQEINPSRSNEEARDPVYEHRAEERAAASKQHTTNDEPGSATSILDQRFKFTNAKPKLYYLPVSEDLVQKRLDELDRQTSRDWDGGRGAPTSGPPGQLRRYMFEDGDKLVDGGVDFGEFGRSARPPPPRRGGFGGGGRRGGGGGGYRGEGGFRGGRRGGW